ncbi:geranylgeranyl pyrophosphate synthase [Cellulomonas chitinilytica]|uniref:Geranylgeranyl pyrophosphate synthase n=1 Tax=Cellulomonas chitinilytica TaxID=398759 RepID=A0A919P273_9CELL|nr:polyprenyl synthetase family protein [Cellulomonas chitinilytica]GIG20533.1 geranylgeranyl pyrophosphate synthase [Cellulomonas chitinilytica]
MSQDVPALVDVEDVRPRVDAILQQHVAQLRSVLAVASADADVLADAVEQMLSGGKRLRAAFCYWSWRAHGGQPGTPEAEAVLRVGAALELFQAAALFHDDVMDDSDTRRGFPAAHRSFSAVHAAHGFTGDADKFGESAAILLGDLTLVASEQEFAGALALQPWPRIQRARAVFDLMRTEVTIGQYLDVLAQALPWGDDPAADEARAREVIRAKSARYSVEHPIVLGAALADADEPELAACRSLGLPLGEAYQLRDDLLGVFGDPDATGKPAGDDLREGKRTVLVARSLARALETGDDGTVALLREHLGDRGMTSDVVDLLTSAIDATGAPHEVEQLIDDLSGRAFAVMDGLAWPEPARSRLAALAHAAVDRHS